MMKKPLRSLTVLGMALLLTVPLGCSPDQDPLAPEASLPQSGLLGGLVGTATSVVGDVTDFAVDGVVKPVLGLLICTTDEHYTASKVIGPAGGTLRVGPHTLTVPVGALREATPISAEAPAGSYAEVRFQPHGLRFERPVSLTMSYEKCEVTGSERPPRVVYVDDARSILEVFNAVPNRERETVTTRTDHFSAYMLAE